MLLDDEDGELTQDNPAQHIKAQPVRLVAQLEQTVWHVASCKTLTRQQTLFALSRGMNRGESSPGGDAAIDGGQISLNEPANTQANLTRDNCAMGNRIEQPRKKANTEHLRIGDSSHLY